MKNIIKDAKIRIPIPPPSKGFKDKSKYHRKKKYKNSFDD